MHCLLLLLGLLFPRLMIVLLWFFSTWLSNVFDNYLWPVLGFVFAPFTFLWYSSVMHFFHGDWTALPILGMVVAISLDMGAYSKSAKKHKK